MIRKNLRRLAARYDARWFGARRHNRSFIRLAYELAQMGEPDEDGYLHHEADLARGLPHADLLKGLLGEGRIVPSEGGPLADQAHSARVSPDDADDLIRLAFRSLLRRDADADTYEAYREAFEHGTTFLDLFNDVTQSEEFESMDERIEQLFAASDQPESTAPEHSIASEMDAALILLETRLCEKGCKIQLGAVPAGKLDVISAQRRMRSLLVTLSLMDRL